MLLQEKGENRRKASGLRQCDTLSCVECSGRVGTKDTFVLPPGGGGSGGGGDMLSPDAMASWPSPGVL